MSTAMENVTTVAFTSNVSSSPDASIFISTDADTTSPYVWASSTGETDSMANDTGYYEYYEYYKYYENCSAYIDYGYDYGDEYKFPGYSFERTVYLYIWEILVLFTSLVNIVVVSILLRRKMRNSINIILAAIAISDSLTGLVTLPTYIMVFQRLEPAQTFDFSIFLTNHTFYPPSQTPFNHPSSLRSGCNNQSVVKSPYDGHMLTVALPQNSPPPYLVDSSHSDYPVYEGYYDEYYDNWTNSMDNSMLFQKKLDGAMLSKGLCRGFMISKFFLSRSFHTMSIFLTLFLAVQRFISLAYPFKSKNMFSVKNTCICCLVIALIAPTFHVFHLDNEKAFDGSCQWKLSESGCKGGCFYLWLMFFLRHFVPCVALITFTALFISKLNRGETTIRRMDIATSQLSRRAEENKRITIVVIVIVIVFLIPEVPYGAFFLYTAIYKTTSNARDTDLETNRAIHMAYELLLVLSFHANFYIYTLFNRRFRKTLKLSFVYPVRWFHNRRHVLSRELSHTRQTSRNMKMEMSYKP